MRVPVRVPVRSGEGRAGPGRAMALLLEHEFKPLPADKQIETLPFLEAVAHLPPFFGEPGPAVCGGGSCGRARPGTGPAAAAGCDRLRAEGLGSRRSG